MKIASEHAEVDRLTESADKARKQRYDRAAKAPCGVSEGR